MTELVRIEGEEGAAGAIHPVLNITLRNLRLQHSRRFAFHGLTGKGLQHDWEMHDAPSCMVRLRHAHTCAVESCSFVDGGSGGVRLDMASQGNHITDWRMPNPSPAKRDMRRSADGSW